MSKRHLDLVRHLNVNALDIVQSKTSRWEVLIQAAQENTSVQMQSLNVHGFSCFTLPFQIAVLNGTCGCGFARKAFCSART